MTSISQADGGGGDGGDDSNIAPAEPWPRPRRRPVAVRPSPRPRRTP